MIREEIQNFIKNQLEINHDRKDYRDFLEVSYAFLGGKLNTPIKKPGAVSRARWMAKATYSL